MKLWNHRVLCYDATRETKLSSCNFLSVYFRERQPLKVYNISPDPNHKSSCFAHLPLRRNDEEPPSLLLAFGQTSNGCNDSFSDAVRTQVEIQLLIHPFLRNVHVSVTLKKSKKYKEVLSYRSGAHVPTKCHHRFEIYSFQENSSFVNLRTKVVEWHMYVVSDTVRGVLLKNVANGSCNRRQDIPQSFFPIPLTRCSAIPQENIKKTRHP